MAYALGTVKVDVASDLIMLTKTRVNRCTAIGCDYNTYNDPHSDESLTCIFRTIQINDSGGCDSYSPKED